MSFMRHAPKPGIETRKATFAGSSLDVEKRVAEVIFSTGVGVLRSDSFGSYMETLSIDERHIDLSRLKTGRAPLLQDHDSSSVRDTLGVVEDAWVSNGRALARVRFAKTEAGEAALQRVLDGTALSVSVGYKVEEWQKVSDGDTPTYLATRWIPYEISIVAIPADAGAYVRSAPRREPAKPAAPKTKSPSQLQGWAARGHISDARCSEAEMKQQKKERVAKMTEGMSAIEAEKFRCSEITVLCKRHGIDPLPFITSGVPLDEVSNEVLDIIALRQESEERIESHVRPESMTRSYGRISVGETSKEKFQRGAAAWLFAKSGNGLVERAKKMGVKGFEKVELDGAEFRGTTLTDLARESLERNGIRTRGWDRQKIVATALTHRSGGYASTGDFPILLENVMNKTLEAAYATHPDTWSRFCRVIKVPDFRSSHLYRVGSFGALPVVGENEEYRNQVIPDGSKLSVNTETRGGIISISRQSIINDDMSAFASQAQQFGGAAKRSLEAEVYALLNQNSGLGPTQSDSQPFFHSNRANVNATGSSLSVAGLDADRVKMAQQMDSGGNEYLDLRPSILLLPISLGSAARVLNESAFDHTNQDLQKPNAVRGMFNDIVDTPRLTGTRRYLFCDPNVAAAMAMVFLESSGTLPYIAVDDGWRVDGTEIKVRIDAKPMMLDPVAAVTNAGQ